MHVEQRHHAQRDVARRAARSCARRCAAEIDRLAWLSGTRFGRPVLPLVCRMSATSSIAGGDDRASAGHAGQTHGPVGVHLDRQHGHAIAGRAARLVGPFGRKEQDACVRIFEIETELVLLVRGVERRGRAGHRGGEKRDDSRQPVGQGDADAIAAADAGGGQRSATAATCVAARRR